MSWPGADDSPGDYGADQHQPDRPTDIASLGVFRNNRLVELTPSQVERALKLMSRPFEDLPQLPFFAPLFSYTTDWQKMEIAYPLVDASFHVGRLLTPPEADALAYYRAKFCSRAAWAPPAVLLTAAYLTHRGRSTFRFPFYTPKPASFNPMSFPSASMPFISGPAAVRLWHLLRFAAYGLMSQLVVKNIIYSYAQTSTLVGALRDDRLKVLRETMPQRRQGTVRPHSPATANPAEPERTTASSTPAPPTDFSGAPQQARQQPRWAQQAPESQSAPQDDDSYLFDDASPVAPSQRQTPPSGSRPSSGGGSAWDRIRERARSEEGAAWNPGQQQDRTPAGRQRGEQYTYTHADQEKAHLSGRETAMNDPWALPRQKSEPEGASSDANANANGQSLQLAMASETSSLPSTATPPPVAVREATEGRIPLTTTFTPSATDCGGIYLPSSLMVYVIDNEPSCLPTGFSTSDSSFFYSPGIACPSGYWTACHDTTGASSITTVTCCPTYGDISLSCVPNPEDLRHVWETLFCTWIAPASPGTVITVTESFNGGRTSTVTESVTSPGGVNAYGVRMLYQASDLQTSTSTTSTTSTATTSTASTSTATASTDGASTASSPIVSGNPSQTTTPDAGSTGGLSEGAKAAIGVVVPVVVLGAVLLGLALWWRRRKRAQQQQREQYPSQYPPPNALVEMPGYKQQQELQQQQHGAPPPGSGGGWNKPAEYYYYYGGGAPPQGPHELPGSRDQPSEMPSTMQAVELPSSQTYPK
ncbi:hypothetical protein MYCTH_2144292 [Thermothelomyces thermophilus ATCC 42464]|uniref:Uncharacterized protein n=1 Tax=Thermothelomyces thermophilus (strain ATCC 42464 / BCRC 31852 / DSM 1799) TaxID=573729 RepID=G2QHP4_THET4|nr:uncharacterized protein MYCTH_2144292 [Thermothelomyces thermophilus ATCC 42464]AEO58904.1 hypothetical protein MYCTH_2144292 [Thermothelomyces thermophilus ATCC 42464]